MSRCTCQLVRSLGSRYTDAGIATGFALPLVWRSKEYFTVDQTPLALICRTSDASRGVGTPFTDVRMSPVPHASTIRRRIRRNHIGPQPTGRLRPARTVGRRRIVTLLQEIRNRQPQRSQRKHRQNDRQ